MPTFYVSAILDALVDDIQHVTQENGYPLTFAHVERIPVPTDRYPKPLAMLSVTGLTRAESDTLSNRLSVEVLACECEIVIQSAAPDIDSWIAMECVFASLNRVESATLSLPYVSRVSPMSAETYPVDEDTSAGSRWVSVSFEVEYIREIDAA